MKTHISYILILILIVALILVIRCLTLSLKLVRYIKQMKASLAKKNMY